MVVTKKEKGRLIMKHTLLLRQSYRVMRPAHCSAFLGDREKSQMWKGEAHRNLE